MQAKTKKIFIMTFATLMLSSSAVMAGHQYKSNPRFQDYAKVTYVEPVYKTVRINRPEQECWDEERIVEHGYGGNRQAGGLVGGIIGGVAGHQVGKGHGKAAATIVGTLLGSTIGRDIAANNQRRVGSHVQTETVCRSVDRYEEEDRLQGYRVGYRYNGHEYDTFMNRHPGKKLKVQVKLVVLE